MPSLFEKAQLVLSTRKVQEKVKLTKLIREEWIRSNLDLEPYLSTAEDRPERQKLSKEWNGKGPKRLVKLIHSIMHAESYAIDLMWDTIVRFQDMPLEFYEDFLQIVEEEANHFNRWEERFKYCTEQNYGVFVESEVLCKSLIETKNSLLARLAIIHLVHEARGLDHVEEHRKTFRIYHETDPQCIVVLNQNFEEEIHHVQKALKWFEYLCEKDQQNPHEMFHQLVRQYFCGKLKPPFNTEARNQANMDPEYYLPLIQNNNNK